MMQAVNATTNILHTTRCFLQSRTLAKPGCNLRVWIDGEEWFRSPTLHSENIWHIPLESGLQRVVAAHALNWHRNKMSSIP